MNAACVRICRPWSLLSLCWPIWSIITGGFHEDGLADTADALGGGWTKPRMLEIMHDSRIGSFGTLAIVLSLLARWALLSALPVARFPLYLLTAHVLCRWTTLPLGAFLESARTDGLGAKLAHKIPLASAAHRNAAGICDCRLGAAHAGADSDCTAVSAVTAAQRLVLPLADWRHHRRLLWHHQSAGRNRGLCLRGVGMSRTDTQCSARCTLILVRHAHTDMAGRFCGHTDPPLSAEGLAQLST